MCLLPKLYSKMEFLFVTSTFDNTMKFKILKFESLNN